MNQQPILHERTSAHLAQFGAAPSHAILLAGPQGVGKTCVARLLAGRVLGIEPEALGTYTYYRHIEPEPDSISIDAIRELLRFLQLKTAGSSVNKIRRIVLIEQADTLTTEAQNAFLKLLEEPPADTLLILTTSAPRRLLPTIRSRLQTVSVHVPPASQTQQYFTAQYDRTHVTQAYFLSGGMPGLMHALLTQEQEHPLFAAVAQAKELLQKTAFERLAMVESLSKQREGARAVLEALAHIAQAGLAAATQKGDGAKVKQWHHILKASQTGTEALLQNANTKLTLTNTFLQL